MSQQPQPNRVMPKSPRRVGLTDLFGFICSGAVIVSFIVPPWLSESPGMGILTGVQATPSTVVISPLMIVIPLVGLLGLVLTLIGIIRPPLKRLVGWLLLVLGVAGLAYYVNFMVQNGGVLFYAGIGFWIALFGSLGLVLQVLAPRPTAQK